MTSATAARLYRPRSLRQRREIEKSSPLPPLVLPLGLLTLFCFCYVGFIGIESYLNQELARTKKRVSKMVEEKQKLQFEVIRLQSASRIERFAIHEGMVFPDQARFVRVLHSPMVKAKKEPANHPYGLLSAVKQILARFLG